MIAKSYKSYLTIVTTILLVSMLAIPVFGAGSDDTYLDPFAENIVEDDLVEDDWIPEELADYIDMKDYEVSFSYDSNGNEGWYLINNLEGTRIRISELNSIISNAEATQESNQNLRKIILIMTISAILVVSGLIAAIVILALRNHDNKVMIAHLTDSVKKTKAHENILSEVREDVENYIAPGATSYEEE